MSQESAFKPLPPRRLSSNLAWNVTAFAAGIVVTFFIAPLLIHSLGDGPYGVLALMSEITGYYGLLDLGMRTAVSYFVARGAARNDFSSINDTMHNVFWLLAGLAGVAGLIGAGVVWAAPHWFNIVGVTANEARIAIAVTSGTFALSLPASVFSATLYGLRRLDMVNGVNLFFRVGSVIPIVILLQAGGGLVSFVVLQSSITVLRWLTEAWLVRRAGLTRNLLFPIRWNRKTMGECVRYGMGNTTINISQLISGQFDLMVIAAFIDTRWVTVFYVARTICNYYRGVISAIVHTFTPHVTHLDSRGERKELVDFYLRISRIVAYVSTWLMVGLVVFGRPFVALWIGESYVSGNFYYRTDTVMYFLVAGLYFRTLQSMAWQVLLGSRELAFLTWVNIAEAVANLGLSVLLVRSYGLVGVAAGTAIPMWIAYGVAMPIYMVRKYEISWSRYLQAVLRPAAVTCVVFGPICWLAVTEFYPHTLWQLFASATVVSLLYGVFVVLVELNKEERSLIRERLSQLAPSLK